MHKSQPVKFVARVLTGKKWGVCGRFHIWWTFLVITLLILSSCGKELSAECPLILDAELRSQALSESPMYWIEYSLRNGGPEPVTINAYPGFKVEMQSKTGDGKVGATRSGGVTSNHDDPITIQPGGQILFTKPILYQDFVALSVEGFYESSPGFLDGPHKAKTWCGRTSTLEVLAFREHPKSNEVLIEKKREPPPPIDPALHRMSSKERKVAEPEIFETVFRYVFRNNSAGIDTGAYFLNVYKQDPARAFLDRFSDLNTPVRPGSEFKEKAGVLFSISGIVWIDDNTVKVAGSYYAWSLDAGWYVFFVIRKDKKWIVNSVDPKGIA